MSLLGAHCTNIVGTCRHSTMYQGVFHPICNIILYLVHYVHMTHTPPNGMGYTSFFALTPHHFSLHRSPLYCIGITITSIFISCTSLPHITPAHTHPSHTSLSASSTITLTFHTHTHTPTRFTFHFFIYSTHHLPEVT